MDESFSRSPTQPGWFPEIHGAILLTDWLTEERYKEEADVERRPEDLLFSAEPTTVEEDGGGNNRGSRSGMQEPKLFNEDSSGIISRIR